MTPEIFAEWFRLQGQCVYRTPSTYWVENAPRVYQAFPYEWIISPPEAELTDFLYQHRAIVLRYSAPYENPQGMVSYHVVNDPEKVELEQLGKKARYDVRKSLAHFTFGTVSLQRLAAEGWSMRADTLMRQGRTKAETLSRWQKLCESAGSLPGFEGWAAYQNDRLCASLIAYIDQGCCRILYQQSKTEDLLNCVNNGLLYSFTKEITQRLGERAIFYGLHSLDAPQSVDAFKFRMGYIAKPVRQRVVFHPLLRPFANSVTYAALGQAHRWRPGNPILAKAEGMLRFYLQGLRPLDEQEWPVPLNVQRSSLNV